MVGDTVTCLARSISQSPYAETPSCRWQAGSDRNRVMNLPVGAMNRQAE